MDTQQNQGQVFIMLRIAESFYVYPEKTLYYFVDSVFDGSSSMFGPGLRCWLYYAEEHIYYQLYKSEYRWFLDKLWNHEMGWKYNQMGTDVADLWKAESAIRNLTV